LLQVIARERQQMLIHLAAPLGEHRIVARVGEHDCRSRTFFPSAPVSSLVQRELHCHRHDHARASVAWMNHDVLDVAFGFWLQASGFW